MQKIDWRLILPLGFLFIIGLLGFVLPAWLVGLSKAARLYAPTELSEQWLGFFGNIIGALIALLAAAIAWIAAQRQIKFARQQSAVVAYEALCKVLETVVAEAYVVDEIKNQNGSAVANLGHICDHLRSGKYSDIEYNTLRLKTISEQLLPLEANFRELAKRPWGTAVQRQIRAGALMMSDGLAGRIRGDQDAAAGWVKVLDHDYSLILLHLEFEIVELRKHDAVFRELIEVLWQEHDRLHALLDRNYTAFIGD